MQLTPWRRSWKRSVHSRATRTAGRLGRIALRLEALEDRFLPSLTPHILPGLKIGTVGSFPSHLVEVNGRAFFAANDGLHGAELWVSDGTAGGTRLVKDIRPGAGSSSPNYRPT
jgi:ELWxxDGT repeat protein